MTKYIIANWKMRMTQAGARAFVQGLSRLNDLPKAARPILCPPFPLIETCIGSVDVGAQNCAAFLQGPYTGEVSASLLKEMGCKYVILGHSERRTHFGETNAIVRQKAGKALQEGMTPILCVGEPLDVYKKGDAYPYLEKQLAESLPDKGHIILAYEPVWAIGTGEIPTLKVIDGTHQFLQKKLPKNTPIIYGGSVTGDNAKDILGLSSVSGVLVGGASLSLDAFVPIIRSV
jgi:triosephosphate isomerase